METQLRSLEVWTESHHQTSHRANMACAAMLALGQLLLETGDNQVLRSDRGLGFTAAAHGSFFKA